MHTHTCTHISADKLGQVGVPDVIHVGPLKQSHTLLVRLKGLLKVVVLLQEHSKVDNDLGSGYFEVDNAVVHSFSSLQYQVEMLW